MHGMPVSLLMRDAAAAGATRGREWDFLRGSPRLEPSALVYVGLRDLDPEEAALVRSLGILAFSMQDVDQRGIARVMAAALRHLKGRPLHLSFDVDAVDPGVIAATGTAVPGGLSYREAHFVCEAVAATSRLVSMDLVELNPTIGAAASLGSGAGAGAGAGADGAFSQAGVASTAYAASFVLSALGKVTLPKVVKPPRAPRKPAAAAAAAAVPGQVADLPQGAVMRGGLSCTDAPSHSARASVLGAVRPRSAATAAAAGLGGGGGGLVKARDDVGVAVGRGVRQLARNGGENLLDVQVGLGARVHVNEAVLLGVLARLVRLDGAALDVRLVARERDDDVRVAAALQLLDPVLRALVALAVRHVKDDDCG
jgi:hypothetical protein